MEWVEIGFKSVNQLTAFNQNKLFKRLINLKKSLTS